MRMTIVALATLICGVAVAQVNPNEQNVDIPAVGGEQARIGRLGSFDRSFVEKAATTNLAQISLGQLAVRNGTTNQVRDLGQRMIDDHTKANDQLRQIATREGVTLPTEVTAKQKADYDRLSSLSGDAFNRAYMDLVKTDQKQAVSLFQDETKKGTDPELKSFAKSTLPELHQHRDLASRPVPKM